MPWPSYLERGWPLTLCALLATAAYCQARGLSFLLAAEIRGEPAARVTGVSPRPPTDAPPDAAPILRRNPFDSVTGPLDGSPPPPEPEPVASAPPSTNPLADPVCKFGHVSLIVTSGPSYAFAAIHPLKGNSRLYEVGDTVSEHQLQMIAWDRVWLQNGSGRCQMRLSDKRTAAKKKPPERRRGRGRKRRSSRELPKQLADKIDRISDTEYRIDRSAFDAILEQQTKLMRGTRARPVSRNGQVVGLRMGRVGSGSLMHTIGIRNGDVIKSINGFALSNPQKALEAYGRLRTASNLSLVLERGGKPVTIDYRLQ